jgi:nicotinamidase/pyrazinamidase
VKRAFIVVDLQRDFCEGGALPVHGGLALTEKIQNFIINVRSAGSLIAFTQDWHPANHGSFKPNGGEWPVHCLAGSDGAELAPPLAADPGDILIHKGLASEMSGYSAFESTSLYRDLRARQIMSVAVSGIALEFCVCATALEARRNGFETIVLTDLVRPMNPDEVHPTFDKLVAAGVRLDTADHWLSS